MDILRELTQEFSFFCLKMSGRFNTSLTPRSNSAKEINDVDKKNSKTVEYKNSLKGKSLNKKVLINNCKLKIPKTKLSMEIKNKKNANDNKEFKKVLKNGRQKSINNAVSPKFLKLRLFIGEKKESAKNSDKEKSQKIKKRLKVILN